MSNTDDDSNLEDLPNDDNEYLELEENEESVNSFRNTYDLISGPILAENGTIPLNILEFHHSFAFDAQKYFNLCVINQYTLVFISGNIINFFDVINEKIWFRRSSSGGGIGCIKNPKFSHLAIGENGNDPPIIIYNFPSMEIVTILYKGASKRYFRLCYSSDGLLLASQGGYPDYLITIWEWRESSILLQCKSHENNVYNLMFNSSMPGHITTSGVDHIKFWTMPYTFTGLKLQGELGKFGKTDICDVIGICPMPHDKVVSGCEWGNILIWENCMIKIEVCRGNKIPCHEGPITHFEFIDGEIFSIGKDGWIRSWFYEVIDLADPPEDDHFLELQPTFEFFISSNIDRAIENRDSSMLMYIAKKNDNPEDTFWYAQDGNGGIWLIDLNMRKTPEVPKKMFTSHGGPILDMDVTTCDPYVATIGKEGHLHVYNYLSKRLILVHKFYDMGTRVIWLPHELDATGSTLVCGSNTGVIRLIAVSIRAADESRRSADNDHVRLIQVFKPHTLPIVAMSLNQSCKILISCGEDRLVFVFSLEKTETYPRLHPIGYIKIPAIVTCLSWKPSEETTILLGCTDGYCVQNKFPLEPQSYTTKSYELVKCQPIIFRFSSVKSYIRREEIRLRNEKKREEKRAMKYEKLQQLRDENPGLEIDEETFLEDSEEEPPLPEIFIPEVPNRVLMVLYTEHDTIWLFMAGFDAGYIYEYPTPKMTKSSSGVVKEQEPSKSFLIHDADDIEIVSHLFYDDRRYIFLGMQHGEIRICRLNSEDPSDFSDYWMLPMHDHYNGCIPKMLLSCDGSMLLTCGHDGNLFSFVISDEIKRPLELPEIAEPYPLPVTDKAEDITEVSHPSIEEVVVKMENERILRLANEKKDNTLKTLEILTARYKEIVAKNNSLIPSQRIPEEELELDPRITNELSDRTRTEIDLVRQKMAFQVEKSKLGLQKLLDHFIEPITCLPFAVRRILKPETMVHSLREKKLDVDFMRIYARVHRKVLEDSRKIMEKERVGKFGETIKIEEEEEKVEESESFLKGLASPMEEHRLGIRINQMLRKYRARVARISERKKHLSQIKAKEPDPNAVHPEDEAAIEKAKNNIGNYELKTSPKFRVSMEEQNATLLKYKQLLECRKKLHHLREGFNARLRAIRKRKEKIQVEVQYLLEVLRKIHAEIPEKYLKPLPILPSFDVDTEFPEWNLQLEKGPVTSLTAIVKEEIIRNIKYKFPDPFDEEYEVLLLDEKEIQVDRSDLLSLNEQSRGSRGDKTETESIWEREMRVSRMQKKIYEQDCILKYVQSNYESLDEELDEMQRERLDIVTESTYMELFLLTLQQELFILRDYEDVENELRDRVNEKAAELAAVKMEMQEILKRVEEGNREIDRLQDKIKNITADYLNMISENKFCKFLRKIFRRKMKPPKQEDESESSSSSSSDSSSDEGDDRSIDSKELQMLHLDESVCPTGCDEELYTKAFQMREERYSQEKKILDVQKDIEAFTKTSEVQARYMKNVEINLKKDRSELEAYMLEKQQKLNDIDMTVILTCDQLQHFINNETLEKISNCVLFDKSHLSHLYTRIQELQSETSSQYEKHKENKARLVKLETDLKYMEVEIKRLKDSILEEVIKKFGQKVPISTVYEIVLRRMIYNIKPDLVKMAKLFEKQIKCVQDRYLEEIDVLNDLTRENTEKLSFLTVLEDEKLKLRKLLQYTPISEEQMTEIEEKYKKDLEKLEHIIENQRLQKQMICNDIKNLSLKSRLLPPIGLGKRLSRDNLEKDDLNLQDDYENDATSGENTNDSDNSLTNRQIKTHYFDQNNLMQKVIQQLLSDVCVSLNEHEKEQIVQAMSKELMSNLPEDNDLIETNHIIEQAVQNIITVLGKNDEQAMTLIYEKVQENLNNIMQQYKDKT
ncbi:cilia- and flagella-associated protein 44 [Prorops nasuta]|uniref:cilia- and flagella-associated protein 44 n=1 Tax=Prorops nasuta TaxID=863751 RepID=UPI0034CF4834